MPFQCRKCGKATRTLAMSGGLPSCPKCAGTRRRAGKRPPAVIYRAEGFTKRT